MKKVFRLEDLDCAHCAARMEEKIAALDGVISVACGNGTVLELWRVLPEGKGRMSAADYIRGRRIAVGDILK